MAATEVKAQKPVSKQQMKAQYKSKVDELDAKTEANHDVVMESLANVKKLTEEREKAYEAVRELDKQIQKARNEYELNLDAHSKLIGDRASAAGRMAALGE